MLQVERLDFVAKRVLMAIRVLLFLGFVFFGLVGLLQFLQFKADGILLFVFVLMPLVMLIFAHYRRIGRLRTLGMYKQALWHLRWWWLLLPGEAYHQLRVSILVESGDKDEAAKAIAAAEGRLAAPCLFGFRAELARRLGAYREAETQLKLGLEEVPPGVLRTGLLAQLSRLYCLHFREPRMQQEAERMLEEAAGYVSADAHKLLLAAVRGELLYARKEYKTAASQLESALDGLLASTVRKRPEGGGLFGALAYVASSLFAQLTYTQQDEHQFPLFAEFCLTLGRVYEKLKEKDKARATYRKGLSLSKQPFVAEPLESALKRLGDA
jgi:tetratricopeptide (TPR) repeat protein